MIRRIYYFTYMLIISAAVYIAGVCTDSSANQLHYPTRDNVIEDNLSVLNDAILKGEMCNDTNPCQNAGTCSGGACKCLTDYTGSLCETPAWCTWGRCGYGNDVLCVWDRLLQKGDCRCKKEGFHYLPKERKCFGCDCSHGSCHIVDDMLVCKCDEKYALKSSKCELCDCGPWSDRCSFNSRGDKVCQCPKGFASKATPYGTWCEICDCGEHGKCHWNDGEKICDCENGYRSFREKCIECNCGRYGTCELEKSGKKLCTCEYGYAEKDGTCQNCDCNYLLGQRAFGVNCTFVEGLKNCICPPGFKTGSDYCEDINECYTIRPCPANSLCINKPGTFECKCKDGFKQTHSSLDLNPSGCEDIDECSESPCMSQLTWCVNSPGSFDCVCRDGYYSTSGTAGSSYKPAFNSCYEIETQWRGATIALGVILSIGIVWISWYIKKHKSSS